MELHHPAQWIDLRSQTVDFGDICLIFCPTETSPPADCATITLAHHRVREIAAELDFYLQEQADLDALERSEP